MTAKTNPPPAAVKAGKVSLYQRSDGEIVVIHQSRPTIEIIVPAHALERWLLQKLREGVFS